MGKHGPCYHCGVTSTPLWRNGPLDKPVLCNACGSRWRTKGSLVNYTPLQCRVASVIYEEHGNSHGRSTSLNKEKHVKHRNRKRNDDEKVIRMVDSVSLSQKAINEENSKMSSSGSAISDVDALFESADASDLTGPSQSVVWESMEPSRKRTCVNRAKPSSIEKLAKDLHTILQEQQSSSCFSGTSNEDLLLERQTPTGSVEIGHGTILIRHLNESAREDYKDIKTLQLLRNQGRRISPAESTITGNINSTRNLIYGRRTRNTENQRASVDAVKTTIKIPKRFKPCPGDKEPENGGAFIAAIDDNVGDLDLLLDVPCNGSFPEGELLSFGSEQASRLS